MADGEISLQETMQSAVEHYLENQNTAIPGFVIRTINSLQTQQVDVQIAINFKGYDGTSQERPPILNVPVIFPASSTSAITFPLNPGDPVLLIFSQRGLSAWKSSNGYASTPTDYRMHDVKDCFAIPGAFPTSRAPNNPSKRRWAHSTNDLVVAHNLGSGQECEIRLTESGDVIVSTDGDVKFNCNNYLINAMSSVIIDSPLTTINGSVMQTGNYTQIGTFTLGSVNMNLHTHPGVQPGAGVTGIPQ